MLIHKFSFRLSFPILIACAVLVITYRFTAPSGLTWEHGGVDGGELALASYAFGVAHPPGYGLYTLLGWVVMRLPVGTPIQAMQIYTSITAVIAAAVLGLTVTLQISEMPLIKRGSVAACAVILMGLSYSFWSQAIIVEVYTLMTLFFAIGLTFCLVLPTHQTRWVLLAAGHLFGLALTHHLTAILWLPGFLVLTGRLRTRSILWIALGALSGLWPILLMLVRAGHMPVANWGAIETGLPALWDHLTGKIYQGYFEPLSAQTFINGVVAWIARISDEVTWFGVVLILVGIVSAFSDRRYHLLLASVLWIICISGFTGIYGADDTATAYTLPLSALIALYGAMGAALVSSFMRWRWLILAAIMIVLLGNHWQKIDLRQDVEPLLFFEATLDAVPFDSVLVTSSTKVVFTLWYYHFVEGRGTGWIIVDRNLWQYSWYRRNLNTLYPDLPDATGGGTIEQWLRSSVFSERPIAADYFLTPLPQRNTNRIGAWYLQLPPSDPA